MQVVYWNTCYYCDKTDVARMTCLFAGLKIDCVAGKLVPRVLSLACVAGSFKRLGLRHGQWNIRQASHRKGQNAGKTSPQISTVCTSTPTPSYTALKACLHLQFWFLLLTDVNEL